MQSRFFLDIVIRKRSAIFQLFSCENKSLLIRGDSFFVLDFGLHIFDGVISLNVQGDGFTG